MKSFAPYLLAVAAFPLGGWAQLPLNQPVPDVTAYDMEGEAVYLRDRFQGAYSVVVFGCLT